VVRLDAAVSTYLYFAYGSNMLTARLRARTPGARPVATGYVTARRLAFHKLSIDGSGKCDLAVAADDASRAYGVLYVLDPGEVPALDCAEGVGHGYRKDAISIVTSAGVVPAMTYLADRTQRGLRPYGWYKAFVVHGAVEHGLPEPYVASLRATDALVDPDVARRARNRAILAGA